MRWQVQDIEVFTMLMYLYNENNQYLYHMRRYSNIKENAHTYSDSENNNILSCHSCNNHLYLLRYCCTPSSVLMLATDLISDSVTNFFFFFLKSMFVQMDISLMVHCSSQSLYE